MNPLPADAVAAIDRGHLIEAIRIVRERTGLGLKESKDAVERHVAGDLTPLHENPLGSDGDDGPGHSQRPVSALPEAARAAMARGEKLEAVKLVREALGIGLAQAKALVESEGYDGESEGQGRARPSASASGYASPMASTEARLDHLVHDALAEPGRVKSSRWASPALWLVVAVVAAVAWLYLNGSL